MKPSISTLPLRLNRFLAEAGVGSRRDVEELIFSGQVTVNGKVVILPAWQIDPQQDAIKVSGRRVKLQAECYILLHKPEGVVSTVDDPEKRPTVMELIRGIPSRVYPVGRLDINTSGVLLLTNDGELTLRLTHPRYRFPKTYFAYVAGVPSANALHKLRCGVSIPTWSGRYEKTLPAKVRIVKRFAQKTLLELILYEGRQNQVRKMCQAVRHPVLQLVRIKFGFLTARGLAPGQWRYLTPEEVQRLKHWPHQNDEAGTRGQ